MRKWWSDCHWTASVVWVSVSALTLLVGWQEGHLARENVCHWFPSVLFRHMWRNVRGPGEPGDPGSLGKQLLKGSWWCWLASCVMVFCHGWSQLIVEWYFVSVRVTRSTSTDGLTLSDHIEPSVSHSDVSSTSAVYYNVASSKPVCTVCHSWYTDSHSVSLSLLRWNESSSVTDAGLGCLSFCWVIFFRLESVLWVPSVLRHCWLGDGMNGGLVECLWTCPNIAPKIKPVKQKCERVLCYFVRQSLAGLVRSLWLAWLAFVWIG